MVEDSSTKQEIIRSIPKLKIKQTVVYYDESPIFGLRTINAFGAIKPMPPFEEKEKASEEKKLFAETIIQPLDDYLERKGIHVKFYTLTGSVVSNMARKNSDIDILVEIEGKKHSGYTEVWEKDNREFQETVKPFLKEIRKNSQQRIALDLASGDFRSPKYIKALKTSENRQRMV